jgi:hypothetical protein
MSARDRLRGRACCGHDRRTRLAAQLAQNILGRHRAARRRLRGEHLTGGAGGRCALHPRLLFGGCIAHARAAARDRSEILALRFQDARFPQQCGNAVVAGAAGSRFGRPFGCDRVRRALLARRHGLAVLGLCWDDFLPPAAGRSLRGHVERRGRCGVVASFGDAAARETGPQEEDPAPAARNGSASGSRSQRARWHVRYLYLPRGRKPPTASAAGTCPRGARASIPAMRDPCPLRAAANDRRTLASARQWPRPRLSRG